MIFPQYKKNKWLWILVILSGISIILLTFRKTNKANHEGFSQGAPFVSKQNNDIYDSYYAIIYDELFRPQPRVEYEYKQIIDMTQPTKENSVFLDVGSGTGNLVNQLTSEGYVAYGIDKSSAMVNVSQVKFPDIDAKCGNVLDPMAYDRGMFTHITCMDFTLYHFNDKLEFFRNCYHWLSPNGYLIIHLVERNKYNPIVPAAIPSMIENPQEYTEKRITDAMIQFPGFTYKTSTDFSPNTTSEKDNRVVISETFKDNNTSKVRQNELTLYMEDVKNILYVAGKCGFIVQGKSEYIKDKYQYIYVLERQG